MLGFGEVISLANFVLNEISAFIKLPFPLFLFGLPMLPDVSLLSEIPISLSLTNRGFYMLLIPSSTDFILISLIGLLSLILTIIQINKWHTLYVYLFDFIQVFHS